MKTETINIEGVELTKENLSTLKFFQDDECTVLKEADTTICDTVFLLINNKHNIEAKDHEKLNNLLQELGEIRQYITELMH